jgi:hypothetical protein
MAREHDLQGKADGSTQHAKSRRVAANTSRGRPNPPHTVEEPRSGIEHAIAKIEVQEASKSEGMVGSIHVKE